MGTALALDPETLIVGERPLRFHELDEFQLESGEVLTNVVQAYHLDGELNATRDNLVVIFHALTGSADAVGDWWSEVAGPGRVIDTGRYAVLCPNLLGSCYGTDYDGNADPAPRPTITPRDQARLIRRLVTDLEVRSVVLATGGSLGGMVALEWAALYPKLTEATVVFAAPGAHTASAIAWNHLQRVAIELGGQEGLALARMIAMMTYRTPMEFAQRFGRDRGERGFEVESYLDYQGEKLVRRFDIRSYLSLSNAMDSHDVGEGRGGVAAALSAFEGLLVAVGIPGDVLYSAADVREWADAAGAEYREIHSVHGHDSFLIETAQVNAILGEVFTAVSTSA